MDDRQNLSQPESVITTTEKSPSRNLQKKTCTAATQAYGPFLHGEWIAVVFKRGLAARSGFVKEEDWEEIK
jgi:hypothetical protein